MDNKQMFDSLVDNALDFLKRALKELDSSPKHSIINFHAALSQFERTRRCEWCLEYNTADLENSYFNGCNNCDGKQA